MNFEATSLTTFLAVVWFVVYWVLGGVFFAVLTILRLGRIKKVRFSCLFTLLAGICGYTAAYWGTAYGAESIEVCLVQARSKAEVVASLFGCGFSSVFGAFLVGAAVLTFIGLILMSLSKAKSKPWIILDTSEPQEEPGEAINSQQTGAKEKETKFF
jgi:hypothetical protein